MDRNTNARPTKSSASTPTVIYDDRPSVIIPSMLNDPALTVDERTVFMTRYMEARDEAAQHKSDHLAHELESLRRQQQQQMHQMQMQQQMQPAPYMGPYGMPPMPGYAPYGMAQQQPFAGPTTMSSLFNTVESPLATVFNSVNFAFRALVFLGSWYLIFIVVRLMYRFLV